jgi:hypothetical protein
MIDCFQNAKVFQKALEKVCCFKLSVQLWLSARVAADRRMQSQAFEEFVNQDPRVSKLLAKFVNDILKKVAFIAELR